MEKQNISGSTSPAKKKKKVTIILISIVVLLIIIRLILPYIILRYVNKSLNEMEQYTGHVEDINLALIRGAYVINDIKIERIGNEQGEKDTIPFFKASRLDLSVEWKALFKGSVVGEIYVEDPVLNFVKGKHKGEDVKADTSDFRDLIHDLMPLTVNHFQITNGQIHYIDQAASPRLDLAMTDIQAEAFNLSNVNDSDKVLPASLHGSGQLYEGTFDLKLKFDALNKVPTFDLNAELKNMNVTKINDFFKAYGNFETRSGTFGLYTEFAAKEGRFGGYVKPIIKDMKVQQGEGDIKDQIWEAVIGAAAKLLENKREDQIATKVAIEGKFENPDVHIWRAVSYVLRNAFVRAIKPTVDNSISIDKLEDEPKKTLLEKIFGKIGKKEDKKDDKKEDEGKKK
jgi:uncharacterized protein involved in outer membrane biogenesis